LAKIVERYFPDFRRTLNELQRYSSSGSIDASVLTQIDTLGDFDTLIKSLKDKDFATMRKWVANNSDADSSVIYRKIFDSANQFLQPHSIPQCVVILGRYQYQSAFVADQEINLCACLTEMMVDCEYV
jgi:replication factor C small subunit